MTNREFYAKCVAQRIFLESSVAFKIFVFLAVFATERHFHEGSGTGPTCGDDSERHKVVQASCLPYIYL